MDDMAQIFMKSLVLVYAYIFTRYSELGIFALAIAIAAIRFTMLDLSKVEKSASEYILLFVALSIGARVVEPLIAYVIKLQRGISAYEILSILSSIAYLIVLLYAFYYGFPYSSLAFPLLYISTPLAIFVAASLKIINRYI